MKRKLFSTALISAMLSCYRLPVETALKPVSDVESAPVNLSVLEKESKDLGDYTLLMMRIVNADLSAVRKNVIARSIVTVANDIFSSLDEKKQFVVMIAIESKFNTNAKSPVGALGLTQIMPQYAREFGTACGVKDLRDDDLIYPDVNLILGACRFKALLDAFSGQPVPALVAYNAGLASNQLKQLQSLREITNTETASYVVKWAYVKGQADKQTETRREKITIKIRSGGSKQSEKKEDTGSEGRDQEAQEPTNKG